MKKPKGKHDRKANWIMYLDEKKNIQALEDDHRTVEKMIKSKPGWKLIGYYYGTLHLGLKYAGEIFIK